MTTSISSVTQPHATVQPPTVKPPQPPKPSVAPAASSLGHDKVTLRSTQNANQGNSHG